MTVSGAAVERRLSGVTTMVVPEVQRVVLSTMTTRLQRTESADLPRLAGIDQADLRDLRTPRPQVEALPRTYDAHGQGVG